VFAQFFTEYQSNQFQWPSGGLTRYQKLQDTTFSKSVKIVSTEDVRTAQSNGLLSFQLPGDTSTLQVEASLISEDPTTAFIWSGKITSAPGGYVTFIYLDGKTAGFIHSGKDFYEISPIDSNHQFLVKRNNDYNGSGGCETEEEEPPGDDDCLYEPSDNTCPALITVLLILTPEAQDSIENKYGSVDLFALLGQTSVNMAFWNSDIPNKEIRVKWVTKDSFPFSPGLDYVADLTTFKTFAEPERKDNNADLVVFVPHVDYEEIGGYANLPISPDPARAFSIVEINYFLNEYVLAHELGHNFGCRHNWPLDYGDDNTDVCSHGKRYIPLGPNPQQGPIHDIEGSWRTMMAIPVDPEVTFIYTFDGLDYSVKIITNEVILHYSNPAVSYEGEPTGRALGKVADNAGRIRNVGCEISEYDDVSELAVNFSMTDLCTDSVIFTSFITAPTSPLPGVAPYTVYWFWNTTGIFGSSQQFLGTGDTLTLLAHPECPVYWVKCAVVSDDNVVVSRIKKITLAQVPCSCNEEERPARGREVPKSISKAPSFSIFPNPVAQGTLFVQTDEFLSLKTVAYKITDVGGREISNGIPETFSGSILSVPVAGLANGLYFLNLLLPEGTQEIHKFIINKTY